MSTLIVAPACASLCSTDKEAYLAYCSLYRQYLGAVERGNGECVGVAGGQSSGRDGVRSEGCGGTGESFFGVGKDCDSFESVGRSCAGVDVQGGRPVTSGVCGGGASVVEPNRGSPCEGSSGAGDDVCLRCSLDKRGGVARDGRWFGAGASRGSVERVPGRWAESNRKKKEAKKQKARLLSSVPLWRRGASPLPSAGFCETVVSEPAGSAAVSSGGVSGCPSYGQALSDAEREAKESLAKRRAAENAVAERLAKMKLASLEDEKKCQEYADLKHQRIVQWTNEATAKSQRSLEKCKSIDPSSSASQYEIRQQAKDLADTKLENKLLSKVIMENCDNWHELLRSCEPVQDSIDTEAMDLMNDNYLREVKNEENFMVFDDSVTRHLARRA